MYTYVCMYVCMISAISLLLMSYFGIVTGRLCNNYFVDAICKLQLSIVFVVPVFHGTVRGSTKDFKR